MQLFVGLIALACGFSRVDFKGLVHDNKQVSVDFNPCSKLLRLNWTFDPDGIPMDWVTDDDGNGSGDGCDDGEQLGEGIGSVGRVGVDTRLILIRKAASLTGLDSRTKGVSMISCMHVESA
ncbi:hypothetical protein V1478_001766 [Vespula squamosa]|uniref:Uncharacterized protein n=1 Tax=Vespula squamosa TaxID=30214 RepID=A0ABD2BYL0_VESSQ